MKSDLSTLLLMDYSFGVKSKNISLSPKSGRFSFLFFSVNFCLFIVYNVAQQQAGSSDGSRWGEKVAFSSLDKVFANRSENS